jgi:hypothetical protein
MRGVPIAQAADCIPWQAEEVCDPAKDAMRDLFRIIHDGFEETGIGEWAAGEAAGLCLAGSLTRTRRSARRCLSLRRCDLILLLLRIP